MSTYLATQLLGSPAAGSADRLNRLRRQFGLLLVLAGALVFATQTLPSLLAATAAAIDALHAGPALLGGLLGAAATAAGALPVLFARRVAPQAQGTLLALAAGVMLAATCFSLLLPALASAETLWGSRPLAALAVAVGLLAGAAGIALLGRLLPDEMPQQAANAEAAANAQAARRSVLLFVLAVTLHNLPEGLAVGVSATADAVGGSALAWGIAIQDVPEGLAVALALASIGTRPALAFAAGAGSGLVEPVAALAGAAAVGISDAALPWGLALAAGAMLRVICLELLPQALRENGRHTGSALIGGFALMMLLDTALA
ncbi:ZIP family metal transporter [Rhodocyclus tenuis]|uniref:ZIP family zinc transporter n=1 Tax=Rhodocyclus tenuis TaxID=1066 RepID=A0A840G659_RHOTE|nr:ZIP family metal transporter [Rhodocyclus tenuis]MBB4247853.1 ZIP family zinc transporter [Rhodocyclus tenuis]